MEIGSIFELNPDILKDRPVQKVSSLRLGEVDKYGKKHISFTASGREAIALALKSFEQKYPDAFKRCLLPAYMCDSVFFPFERAGWELHFYHLDRHLEVNGEELDKLIGQIKPTLIFIHPYYGVDTWQSVRSFFRGWRKQGICIMEDVTQAYYLESAGKEADYCVGSLRKWYAVPDGGFVASDEELLEGELSANEVFSQNRRELLSEKWEYLHGQMEAEKRRALKADYLRKNRETESWLDEYEGISAISEDAACILSDINEEECGNRRRENSIYLHENIGGRMQVVPVFDRVCPGKKAEGVPDGGSMSEAAPLYYPVYAVDRDDLQKYLALRGVYAPTLWPVGKENADFLTLEERYIYEHILALPVDQRYGIAEMRRVLEVLDQYEAEKVSGSGEASEANRISEAREISEADNASAAGESTKVLEAGAMTKAVTLSQAGNVGSGGEQVIGIRADANETIATGHVMRCITIAKKLISAECRVVFYTADEYAAVMLEQAGMEYVCLHTSWNDMEQEIPVLREKLIQAGCSKLLVDSYQVTERYFEELHDICKLIYIDDCFDAIYPVDMIINYNAYHVRFPYEDAYAGKAKLLLGTSYVPLREEFGNDGTNASNTIINGITRDDDIGKGTTGSNTNENSTSENDVNGNWENAHVLLSSGGGDQYNAMAGILRAAVQDETLQHVIFHTVVGGFNRNEKELRCLAAEHPNIRLHERVGNMAQLMGECTAAISAAGTMLFELSAMQTPTVFFVSADNQQYDHEFFAQEERMLYGGDIREDRDECVKEICRQLRLLLEDSDMRTRMKKRLYEVTDGNGAQRIAAGLLCL